MIKSVISTFSITIITVLFLSKMFFSSLLGVFGYASIPLDELHKLKASQQVVNKLKANHRNKKTKATKRFFKRTGKKVGAAAISAATIGTVAVVGTLTYIEIHEFCEDKRELSNEKNILFNKNVTFDFDACVDELKKDSTQITDEAWSEVKANTDEMVQSVDDLLEPARKHLNEIFAKIDAYFKT